MTVDETVHKHIGAVQRRNREFEIFLRGVSFALRDFDGKDVSDKEAFRKAINEGFDHYVDDELSL